ncbi:MAG: hypothetical protein WCK42_06165, partial [Myxococcaceae bacterium]
MDVKPKKRITPIPQTETGNKPAEEEDQYDFFPPEVMKEEVEAEKRGNLSAFRYFQQGFSAIRSLFASPETQRTPSPTKNTESKDPSETDHAAATTIQRAWRSRTTPTSSSNDLSTSRKSPESPVTPQAPRELTEEQQSKRTARLQTRASPEEADLDQTLLEAIEEKPAETPRPAVE